MIVTKRARNDANTTWAQGGISAVLDPTDTFEAHITDTLTAGAGLCKRDIVEVCVREGPERIADLVAVSGEPYPPVESLVIRSGKTLSHVAWSSVASVNGTIQLSAGAPVDPAPTGPVADRLNLGQEILDRQIVDIDMTGEAARNLFME